MKIIRQSPGTDGGYPPIQDWAGVSPPEGFDQWPDDLEQDTFQQYKGFVITTVVRGVVKSYQPNEAAYQEYVKNHPDGGKEPEKNESPTWAQLTAAVRSGVNGGKSTVNSDQEIVLQMLRDYGQKKAKELQEASASMDGTQLYAQEDWIPDFQAAKAEMNMLERKAGKTDGFVCKSSAGRVVRLLQNYDSDVYTEEPEDLPAQWGFVWSTDSFKALPFVAISTSPYNTGDCASADGMVYRSKADNNVWAPLEYPENWELAGPVGGPFDQDQDEDQTGDSGEGTETIDKWEAPSGAHDAYNQGDRVIYNGVVYKSKINGNVWNPEQYPDFWEVAEG